MTFADGSANVLVANGVVDLLARLAVAGIAFHWPGSDRLAIYAIGNVVFAIAILGSAMCRSLGAFIGAGCLFGIGFGTHISAFGVVMVDLFGLGDFPAVQAFAFLFGGLGSVLVPVAASALADAQSVSAGFLLAGSLNLVGAAASVLLWGLRRASRAAEAAQLSEQVNFLMMSNLSYMPMPSYSLLAPTCGRDQKGIVGILLTIML